MHGALKHSSNDGQYDTYFDGLNYTFWGNPTLRLILYILSQAPWKILGHDYEKSRGPHKKKIAGGNK